MVCVRETEREYYMGTGQIVRWGCRVMLSKDKGACTVRRLWRVEHAFRNSRAYHGRDYSTSEYTTRGCASCTCHGKKVGFLGAGPRASG